MHEFGIIETSGSVRQRFEFRVWDKSPVRIAYIGSTCCGALPIDPNLTGKVLDPGSTHWVDVILGREFTGERAQVDVNIETEPRSSKPIVLTVTGLLIKSVNIHPSPLVIEQTSGTSASGNLRLTRLRTSDIGQLELDQENSELNGLTIAGLFASTEKVGHPSLTVPRFVDSIEMKLSSPESYTDGQHEFSCRFAWKNEGLTSSIVPVTVIVAHPFRPVLDTIFCGEIVRFGNWEKKIRLVRQGGPKSLRVTAVRSDTAGVTGAIDEATNGLVVRVRPSMPVGRFDARLTLSYSDSQIPDFPVKISGIIRGD